MKPPVPKRLRRSPDWPVQPEPPRSWRCYFLGCDIPRRITPGHPSVLPTGPGQGKVGLIECGRCGRSVHPFDRDFPIIIT